MTSHYATGSAAEAAELKRRERLRDQILELREQLPPGYCTGYVVSFASRNLALPDLVRLVDELADATRTAGRAPQPRA